MRPRLRLRLLYALDSFGGWLWHAQNGPEVVLSGKVAEDAVPDIPVLAAVDENMSNVLSSRCAVAVANFARFVGCTQNKTCN